MHSIDPNPQKMQRPTLDVPLAEECELPVVARGNTVAGGGRGESSKRGSRRRACGRSNTHL